MLKSNSLLLHALGFAGSLVGLIALLVVPIVARVRTERYHSIVDSRLAPALARTHLVLDTARKARTLAFSVLLGSPEPPPPPFTSPQTYFKELVAEWRRDSASDRLIRLAVPESVGDWDRGRAAISEWLDEYGAMFAHERPLRREEMGPATNLFQEGSTALERVRAAIEAHEDRARLAIDAVNRRQVLITVPLVALCLLLAFLEWQTLRSLRTTAHRLEVAVKETNHRVKNNLQVVSALLEMERGEPGNVISPEALNHIQQQVQAMAAVHDFFSRELDSDTVAADQMLKRLVPLVSRASTLPIQVDAEPVPITTKQAVAVALIVNELGLNAGKHGARHACVRLRREGRNVLLSVSDDGPGFPEGFDCSRDANLGIALVNTLACYDLRGRAAFVNDGGAKVEVAFPCASAQA